MKGFSLCLPGDVADRGDDVGIGGAAADIAAHAFAHFCRAERHLVQILGDMAGDAGLDLLQHGHGGTDLPRRAIAALVTIMDDERFLHRVQRLGRAQPLDRRHILAVMHHRQRQAAVDAPAFDDDGAGAALAMVAALLGAGELEMFAQRIEQAGARVQLQMDLAAVHGEFDRRHRGSFADGRGRGGLRRRCERRGGKKRAAALHEPAARDMVGCHGWSIPFNLQVITKRKGN